MKIKKSTQNYFLASLVALSFFCCILLNTTLVDNRSEDYTSVDTSFYEEGTYQSTIFSEVKIVKVLAEKFLGLGG